MDTFAFREIERIAIITGAVFIAFLGYKLFCLGITTEASKMEGEGHGFKLSLSGTGPGLFFMAFGSLVLVAGLFSQLTERTSQKHVDETTSSAASKTDVAAETPATATTTTATQTPSQSSDSPKTAPVAGACTPATVIVTAPKEATPSGVRYVSQSGRAEGTRVVSTTTSETERKLGGEPEVVVYAKSDIPYKVGDLVKVLTGRYKNDYGIVVNIPEDKDDEDDPEGDSDMVTVRLGEDKDAKTTKEIYYELTPARPDKSLKRGERVKVLFGTFQSFAGTVESVDLHKGTATVTVTVFGRANSVQVPLTYLKREDGFEGEN